MTSTITTPDLRGILTPLLPSLPAAAISTQPAPAILPLLSPILRQRVQLLSSASTEPWLRLLSYETGKDARLAEVARSDRLEPHPVSGEVEVDWDYNVQTQYRRLDEETLQALVVLQDFELVFRLVYCVNDEAGGGDGWRVGEISVPDKSSPFAVFAGHSSIAAAESAFRQEDGNTHKPKPQPASSAAAYQPVVDKEEEDDDNDDDDDYWARYDATPARTPARTPQVNRSPAPPSTQQTTQSATHQAAAEEDDAYFSQYDNVQPAMDNHDPDEAQAAQEITGPARPALGLQRLVGPATRGGEEAEEANETNGAWTLAPSPGGRSQEDDARTASLAHPRPESSASSNGSNTVLRLEEQAGRQESSEFGVKQHVSRSIRSLFLLSRAAGIDRDEFERMVKTELDVLGMVEEDI
ncbi:hypothetical protein DHEL01_v204780 [Diaporthe helianthi]|uniref:Uncharacterized protein n=1 Tax=Diaporthe helianthi TaxID=158607 RepID=A0A2P5I2T9_DIAHE|nr:hypothetical protein DHEL01_v204780 [Diaporthe helianthi]